MSQIEITQILEQIREEIEVDASGKGKASMKATARRRYSEAVTRGKIA
jgi:hypothetical protein